MANPGSIFNIPHYLKAASPEGLRLKMLENNIRLKAECQYFDISYDGKVWVVWFYFTAAEATSIIRKRPVNV